MAETGSSHAQPPSSATATVNGTVTNLAPVVDLNSGATLQEMITNLKINDEVVTNGGIIGKIKEIRETSFIIQSAEKTFLEIGKSAVIGRKAEEKK